MRPSSFHLSVTLSPPKPLGGIQPSYITSPNGRVSESNIIFLCVRPSVRPSSVHLSIKLSPLKTTGRDLTKLVILLPFMVMVCKSNTIFLCVCPGTKMCLHWVFFILFCRLLVGTFNVLLGIFYIRNVRLSVRASVVRLSRYLLLNLWAEFNQTCYITWRGHYAKPSEILSVRPSVPPFIRPRFHHSCPTHNFNTVQDIFTKFTQM